MGLLLVFDNGLVWTVFAVLGMLIRPNIFGFWFYVGYDVVVVVVYY